MQTFSYKNFDLNIIFQGAAKVNSRLAGALAEMGNQEGFTHEIYTNNYWTPEHTDARFPRPVKYDLRNVATSDRLVLNGSYLRLKNVQLAYNMCRTGCAENSFEQSPCLRFRNQPFYDLETERVEP